MYIYKIRYYPAKPKFSLKKFKKLIIDQFNSQKTFQKMSSFN